MWFSPQTLSLIVTHRCTAACEHCCFACSPKVEAAIPLPRLQALVEEAAEVPSIRQVVFTGGECFLLGQELDRLIRRCTDRGLGTRCVSNGSWAGSPEAAGARVAALQAAGLRELNLSTGSFHARFVPWERVVWGAAAAAAGGLAVAINIEAFEGSGFPVEAVTGHPLLQPFLADHRILVTRGAWIPNGAEAAGGGCGPAGPGHLAHAEAYLRFSQETHKTPCTCSLLVVSVTPSQQLVCCCGLNLEHIPALRLGSVRDRSLAQALEAVEPDLIKMWIHVEGPERVLEFVREKAPGFRLPLESAHICHTCQYLHDSPEALEVLRRHGAEVEGRILEKHLLAAAGHRLAAQL